MGKNPQAVGEKEPLKVNEKLMEGILNFISSPDVKTKLIEIIQIATEKYKGKDKDSYAIANFVRTLAGSRTRAQAAEELIKHTKLETNTILLLQEFVKTFQEGDWKTTSLNTRLMRGLAASIDGFKTYEKNSTKEKILFELAKDAFIGGANVRIKIYEQEQQRIKERREELERMNSRRKQIRKDVVLRFNGKQTVDDVADAPLFDLIHADGEWLVLWNDALGEKKELDFRIHEELGNYLKRVNPMHLNLNDVGRVRKIQDLCHQAYEFILSECDVLVKDEEEELSVHPYRVFVLSRFEGEWTVDWYNTKGDRVEDLVQDNPDSAEAFKRVQAMLDSMKGMSKKELFVNNSFNQFREVLRHLSTSAKLTNDVSEVAKVLKKEHGVSLLIAEKYEQIRGFQRIPGTYIITCDEGVWQLAKLDDKRIRQVIDTSQWHGFAEQLAPYTKSEKLQKQIILESLREELMIYDDKGRFVPKLEVQKDFESYQLRKKLKSNTYYLSIETGGFAIYYANGIGTTTKLNLRDYPELSEKLAGIKPTIEDFSKEVMLDIASTLPAAPEIKKLDRAKVLDLERELAPLRAKQQRKIGRLNLSEYEKVKTLFGVRAEQAPERSLQLAQQSSAAFEAARDALAHKL